MNSYYTSNVSSEQARASIESTMVTPASLDMEAARCRRMHAASGRQEWLKLAWAAEQNARRIRAAERRDAKRRDRESTQIDAGRR